jgi:hypothetical protein
MIPRGQLLDTDFAEGDQPYCHPAEVRWTLFHRLMTRSYSGFLRWCPNGFSKFLQSAGVQYTFRDRGLVWDQDCNDAMFPLTRPDVWACPTWSEVSSPSDEVLTMQLMSGVACHKGRALDFLVRACCGDPSTYLRPLTQPEADLLAKALGRSWVGDLVPIRVSNEDHRGPLIVGGE